MTAEPDHAPRKRFHWLKWPRRLVRNEDGAVAVEFAMVALPLFALIFAALQAAIVLMAEQELETAAEQAGRLVMTEQVSSLTGLSTSLTQAQFHQKVCGYLVALFNCNNVIVNMTTSPSFSSAGTTAPTITTTNTWQYNTGNYGSIVVLQVIYEWPILGNFLGFNLATLSNGTRLLMATAVFQNEPP